jgi:hypothetical protein
MKPFRCQERGQIQAKSRVNETPAFIAFHDRAVMKWVNEQDQCDPPAEFLEFVAEEHPVPFGVALEQLGITGRGHPQPLFVPRNCLVRCPVHGKRVHFHIGHPVSAAEDHRLRIQVG